MRLPRMTTRRWMIAVAGVGIVLGASVELQRRHDRFLHLAKHHEMQSFKLTDDTGLDARMWSDAKFEWHRRLGEKYRRAATSPWLPVEPDPPAPPE
jgi:hypothetical protein